MKLLVIGATGMAGSRVVGEALARGHEVTAVSRNGGSMPPSVTAVRADVTDVGRMTSLFAAADTVVCAIRPRRGEEPSSTIRATSHPSGAPRPSRVSSSSGSARPIPPTAST
ncbi:NAD(P)-dependent oxidoreductase [Saccharomonospora azurea]